MSMSLLPHNIVLKLLTKATRQEDESRTIKIRQKQVKLLLFVDDLIKYAENPRESTKKLLRAFSEVGRV